MKFIKYLSFTTIVSYLISCTGVDKKNEKNVVPSSAFYNLKIILNDGSLLSSDSLKGKKVLLVNTASECGYTKQYEDLEKLYAMYKNKLVIVAFPANDFGGQEPGDDSTIVKFCKQKYSITFPIALKSSVKKGSKQNEVFKWLSDSTLNGWNNSAPTWNFAKYLVDENGSLTHFFPSAVKPLDEKIISALK